MSLKSWDENDHAKMLRGEPNLSSSVVDAHNEMMKNTRKDVANMTLAALRHLRDNCPDQWDALQRADKNCVLNGLWDYLRSLTK